MSKRLKVAVVQPRLRVGEVDANLARCADLVRSAHREHAPEVILLPEAMTSPTCTAVRCAGWRGRSTAPRT